MSLSARAALVVAASVALWSAVAQADAVEGPPEHCPAGSTPGTSHSGPHCRPLPDCLVDADCSPDERCVAVSQCIEERQCGGLTPPGDAGRCTLEHVIGACDGAGSCEAGASCRERRVCSGEPPERPSTCGCDAPGAGARRRGALGIALAAAMVFLRRARRRE